MLQHATALQQLQLECRLELFDPEGVSGGQPDAADQHVDAERVGGVASLLRAVCSMPALEVSQVWLGVQLSKAEAKALRDLMQQQLPDVQRYCVVNRSIVSLLFYMHLGACGCIGVVCVQFMSLAHGINGA
jgi:hypothetical protein